MIKRDSFYGTWSRRIDWPTMAAIGVLLIIGLFAVFSAVNPSGASVRFMLKQLLAIGLGVIAIFVLSSLNYQIFRAYPWVIYVLTLIALIGVLVLGRRIHGAKSWIVLGPLSFEPVEIARIGFILVIAAVLDHPEREMNPLKWMINVFALGAVHMGLILREPYLGGTLVYMPIMLAMLYFAGIPSIYLLAIIFYGSVAVGIPLISTYFSMQPQLLSLHPVANFFVSIAS